MISRSFNRPVINRWPSCRNPRSPVRRNGPSSIPGIRALNVSSVSFAFRQYPCATLGPLIHISPTSPALHSRSESGETIRTACSTGGRPQPTSSLPSFRDIFVPLPDAPLPDPPLPDPPLLELPLAPWFTAVTPLGSRPPLTNRVASA